MRARATAELVSLRRRAAPVLKSAGFSTREIGCLFGIKTVQLYIPKAGSHKYERDLEREQAMVAAFRRGETLEDIGAVHRVTRERVRQILIRLGIKRTEGGAALNRKKRSELASRNRDTRYVEKFGMPYAEYRALLRVDLDRPAFQRPVRAFSQQRNNAMRRGIPWHFTLGQWWTIWLESGKWGERGRGHGAYVMARKGDCGAYEPGNVEIILADQNVTDSYIHTPPAKRRNAIARDEYGLTPAERRVYEIAKDGLGPTAVGKRLQMSPGTVAQYVLNIRKRAPHLPFAERAA